MSLFCVVLLSTTSVANAEPVPVRFPEGTTHAYLSLKTVEGRQIAQGELIQTVRGKTINARLLFRFKDGSLHDERVTYSQHRIFRMEKYHLVQTGETFPTQQEVTLNRKSQRFSFRSWVKGETTISREGIFPLPDDAYNGMLVTLLKNLRPGKSHTVHYVAFTPQPKLYPVQLRPTQHLTVQMGPSPKPVTLFKLKPTIGLITRLVGTLFGKLPLEFHYHVWFYTDDIPVFAAFEGPLYVNGPTWRIEQKLPNLFQQLDHQASTILTKHASP